MLRIENNNNNLLVSQLLFNLLELLKKSGFEKPNIAVEYGVHKLLEVLY